MSQLESQPPCQNTAKPRGSSTRRIAVALTSVSLAGAILPGCKRSDESSTFYTPSSESSENSVAASPTDAEWHYPQYKPAVEELVELISDGVSLEHWESTSAHREYSVQVNFDEDSMSFSKYEWSDDWTISLDTQNWEKPRTVVTYEKGKYPKAVLQTALQGSIEGMLSDGAAYVSNCYFSHWGGNRREMNLDLKGNNGGLLVFKINLDNPSNTTLQVLGSAGGNILDEKGMSFEPETIAGFLETCRRRGIVDLSLAADAHELLSSIDQFIDLAPDSWTKSSSEESEKKEWERYQLEQGSLTVAISRIEIDAIGPVTAFRYSVKIESPNGIVYYDRNGDKTQANHIFEALQDKFENSYSD